MVIEVFYMELCDTPASYIKNIYATHISLYTYAISRIIYKRILGYVIEDYL